MKNPFDLAKNRALEQARAEDKAKDAKCIPLAQEYVKLIANANLSLTNKTHEEYIKEYSPLVAKMLEKYLEANIKISEAIYVKKLVLEMIENLDSLLVHSVNDTLRIGEKTVWGTTKDELTFQQLDDKLRQWALDQTLSERYKQAQTS